MSGLAGVGFVLHFFRPGITVLGSFWRFRFRTRAAGRLSASFGLLILVLWLRGVGSFSPLAALGLLGRIVTLLHTIGSGRVGLPGFLFFRSLAALLLVRIGSGSGSGLVLPGRVGFGSFCRVLAHRLGPCPLTVFAPATCGRLFCLLPCLAGLLLVRPGFLLALGSS